MIKVRTFVAMEQCHVLFQMQKLMITKTINTTGRNLYFLVTYPADRRSCLQENFCLAYAVCNLAHNCNKHMLIIENCIKFHGHIGEFSLKNLDFVQLLVAFEPGKM